MSELHVVFGAGPLGRSVVEELVRRGKSVRVVSRSGEMAEAPQGVELVAGDLYDPAPCASLTAGAAVAYQCAQPHYWEWPQKFPPLQAAIIDGLTGTDAKLVIGENTYMYGDTNGKPLTEDLPYAATTRKGKVRAAMSEAALARAPGRQGAGGPGPRLRLLRTVGGGLGVRRPRLLLPRWRARRPASAASWTCRTRPPTSTTSAVALVILGERDEASGPGVARAQRPAADHAAPVRGAALSRDRPPGQSERREQADDVDGWVSSSPAPARRWR